MIAIIDYGLGNVKAFANVYRKLGLPVVVAARPEDLDTATHLVLPGVGAFDQAMLKFEHSGLREETIRLVTKRHLPLLGVCVGMHMLACRSEEGKLPGLSLIGGDVRRLGSAGDGIQRPVPHMGWNDVRPREPIGLFRELGTGARFYFLHSYYFDCRQSSNVLAETDYGDSFCCAVGNRNVWGVQFHPEKSHGWGIQLLKNFAEL